VTTALNRYLPDNLKNPIIALASGLATPLGFAPFGFYPVPFITMLLLILLSINSDKKKAFLYGYLFGLGYFGHGVNWLHISINLFGGINLAGAWFITLLLVLYLAIFPALFSVMVSIFTHKRRLSYPHILVIPASWSLLEWARGWLLTGFPWLNLGYSQTDTVISGLAPVVGVYGIGFIMLMINILILFIYKEKRSTQILTSMLIIIVGFLTWMSKNWDWTEERGEILSVALIQGAIPQEIKWSPDMRQPTKGLYQDFTIQHLDADLIIWPEAAIPAYYHQELPFLDQVHRLVRENGSALITGIPVYDRNSDRFFNSVVYLDDTTSFYYKQHLVPFGEYLPMKFLLQPVVDKFNIPIADFSRGDQTLPILQADNYKIGISICYEDTFGSEVIRALPGANILVNISNDAWFGDSIAPHQHLQIARMRAQETGRYLLRATNTGITAIIDENGNITSRGSQFIPVSLTGEVKLFQGFTPYSRTGNYPVISFCLFVIVLIGYCYKKSSTAHPASLE
jgi:apolipoprotein N-acyltransferase